VIQAKRGRTDTASTAKEIITVMLPTPDQVAFTISQEPVDTLPRFSGVYRFYDVDGALLYIGKSVDIRSRIAAHYQEGKQPGRHQRIMQQVARIDCTATAGEVGALLIENAAIKEETPLYNRRQRRVRKLWSIHLRVNDNGFLQPVAVDFLIDGERSEDSYGLFHNKRHVDNSLRRHARDHGLCLRMLGLDKGKGPCFQFQLSRCDGACAGKESPEEHNSRLLSVLDRDRISAWPFPGPLALVESNVKPLEGQPTHQTHLVNHWCYLGSFDSPSAAKKGLKHVNEQYFDRDAYHLLLSALRKGRLSVFDARSGLELDNPLLGDMTRS
jgi:excinuclease Cho